MRKSIVSTLVTTAALMTLGFAVIDAGAAPCPARIRIAFADSPAEPLLNGEGASFADPPGVGVEWLRSALRRLGCLEHAELSRLPAARMRMEASAQQGQIDLVPGVPEGSPNAVPLVLPTDVWGREQDVSMGLLEFSLFARAADTPSWDGRRLALQPGQTVGATRGTATEFFARDQGWPLELAPSYESSYQKFMAGRSNYLFIYAPFMEGRTHDTQTGARWQRLEPPVLVRRFHIASSRDFYRREPEFVQRLWVEMCLQGNAMRPRPLKCQPHN